MGNRQGMETVWKIFIAVLSDPGPIRTGDPQLRRLLLYPAELRDRRKKTLAKSTKFMIYITTK